jgi:hypothetical protein
MNSASTMVDLSRNLLLGIPCLFDITQYLFSRGCFRGPFYRILPGEDF